ncbi:hypothetical protein Agub_g2093 [Astrephomene gubernaculifera]|uniref:Protein kinase domain-containing protein n=1 Tax=Astrephomene gubernaculifera TaxID=47775 RepID=A0AAD3DGJ8_9CHLO|nr:hypothetical protein Agub_g2093 [Astrephomene gubernaculifera]
MERAFSGLSKLASRKSTKDFAQLAGGNNWPTEASAYQILDDCGRGVSATVHRAKCLTNNETVAVKLMNLESMNCDLDEIIHEAQTMRMYNHPNILPLYCSFVHGQELWMVMPFVSGGSVLHIMKYAHPEGLDEVIIATIGREVLKGLDYVHKNGSIHRDVKAGNILVDGDGNVKLGDFGVAASLERGGSWGHDKQARMTFVGTPCWMAPEVMEQTMGYDVSADIWSFGITLLEMAHGHAPFAKFPPMKVLLMTLQNPAPTLEDKGKKHFSKALKDLVTRCLQKEKEKRPSAAQLLEHKFFKIARDSKFLKEVLVGGLPALSDRVNLIRIGQAATNKQDNDRNLEKSQEEYRKGVSSWNFDLAALKAQAALEPDDESTHGANMLPTISESDEREDTLTGASASAAAQFVAAQWNLPAPAVEASGSRPYMSAFATASGQDPTAKTQTVLPLSGALGPSSSEVSSVASLRPVASGDQQGAAVERCNTPSGEAPPQSPGGGGISPAAGLSREGSVVNIVGIATTPTAVTKQKKGRFEVSEHAVPAPAPPPPAPMHHAATVPLLHSSSSASGMAGGGPSISGGNVPDLSALRPSDLAALRTSTTGLLEIPDARDDGVPSLMTEVEASVTSVEPKQRGRFKIVAEQGTSDSRPLSKAPSMANLNNNSQPLPEVKDSKPRLEAGGSLMGKPPTAPSSIVTPVTVVLPKLQELLDHAAAHQAALQKLIGAVQECDKGRVPMLLSRSQSTKSLFDSKDLTPPVESMEELRLQVLDLKSKVSSLEEENTRLRERNKVLETLHCAAHTVRFSVTETGSGSPKVGTEAVPSPGHNGV